MKLERADRRILKYLQRDGRISNQDLAEASAMSASACWRRVRALQESGIIQGYAAIVNPEACGLEFHAILHVVLTRHEPGVQKHFVQAMAGRAEILDCFSTTGDADYHLRIRCPNKEAYNAFLEDFMFRIPGIATVRTNLVLREIKHEISVPVEYD